MTYQDNCKSTGCRPAAKRRLVAALAVSVVSGLAIIPAMATPGSGFTPTPVSKGSFRPLDVKADKTGHWDLFLKTKEETDIGVDRISVVAGGFSGWHTHAGTTLVTVTAGEIEWFDATACSRTTYRAGDTFVEQANRVHQVANNSEGPAEFVAIQIRPKDAPGRIDAAKPECPR